MPRQVSVSFPAGGAIDLRLAGFQVLGPDGDEVGAEVVRARLASSTTLADTIAEQVMGVDEMHDISTGRICVDEVSEVAVLPAAGPPAAAAPTPELAARARAVRELPELVEAAAAAALRSSRPESRVDVLDSPWTSRVGSVAGASSRPLSASTAGVAVLDGAFGVLAGRGPAEAPEGSGSPQSWAPTRESPFTLGGELSPLSPLDAAHAAHPRATAATPRRRPLTAPPLGTAAAASMLAPVLMPRQAALHTGGGLAGLGDGKGPALQPRSTPSTEAAHSRLATTAGGSSSSAAGHG
ncbi:unnamed protein product [Prorocentrum cordatum]|nr:unnamed protein product [Polarella glacialis]